MRTILGALALMTLAGTAGAAPWQIAAQGTIYTADGRPAQGVHVVTFRVYDAGAEAPLWEEDVPLGLVDGRFAAMLPNDPEDLSLSAALLEAGAAELAVVLDDGVELERGPLGGAPYAVVAERVRHVSAAEVGFDDAASRLGASDTQAALGALAARLAALEEAPALPPGAVLMFLDACPAGWSEVSGLAGRVPLGAGPGFPIASSGGALAHGHVVTVQSAGAHQHDASGIAVSVDKLSGGMADLASWMPTIACASSSQPAGGSCSGFAASAIYHNHPASAAGQVAVGGAHTHGAGADEASHLPPYQVVRFCAKP